MREVLQLSNPWLGHYAFECPHNKRKEKQHASTADIDEDLPKKKSRESRDDDRTWK